MVRATRNTGFTLATSKNAAKQDYEIASSRKHVQNHNKRRKIYTPTEKLHLKKCCVKIKRLRFKTIKRLLSSPVPTRSTEELPTMSTGSGDSRRTRSRISQLEAKPVGRGSILEVFSSTPEKSPVAMRNNQSKLSLRRRRTNDDSIAATNLSTSSTNESSAADICENIVNETSKTSHSNNTSIPSKQRAPSSKRIRTSRCAVRVQRITSKQINRTNQLKSPAYIQTHSTPVISNKTNRVNSKTRQAKCEQSRPSCQSPDLFEGIEMMDGSTDIYAFNSQTSTSEHDELAAGVIKKLEKQGKITVQKRRNKKPEKGTKKPGMKGANWRIVCKNLSIVVPKKNTIKEQGKAKGTAPKSNVATSVGDDTDHHFDDGLEFADAEDLNTSYEVANKSGPSSAGGLSALAQSVLSKQVAKKAGVQSTSRTENKYKSMDKAKLLQMAKNFVNSSSISHSTPFKPPPLQHRILSADRSTATNSPASGGGGASPWRVDNDSVPRLFYFSRTNDDLPSYSSDVLPASQPSHATSKRNESSRTSRKNVSSPKIAANSTNTSHIEQASPGKLPSKENSLNISNIENISPVKPIDENRKQTEVLFGMNPRRGLPDRSPLKTINVLNVVNLPNRVKPAIERSALSRNDKDNMVRRSAIVLSPNQKQVRKSALHENKENRNESHNNNNNNSTLNDASTLFGFSDDNEDYEEDVVYPLPKSKLPSKRRLHKKLSGLKRLLPPKPVRFSYDTIRSVLGPPKKQATIREMLSSTRNKSTNKSELETSRFVSDDSSNEASNFGNSVLEDTTTDRDVHLFDDPEEPQTSFDASLKIRTYERPKRKRKRVHNFLLFSSDTEEEEEKDKKPSPKKRTKADKNKKELKKFVNEFNSMCEEVDKYELVVEKDKSGLIN